MQTLCIHNNRCFFLLLKRKERVSDHCDMIQEALMTKHNKTSMQPSYRMNTNPLSDKAKPDLSDSRGNRAHRKTDLLRFDKTSAL